MVGAQTVKIGGEANGVAEEEVVNVVVAVVDFVMVAEVDAVALDQLILIPLLATGVGCVAIWPMTIPKPVMHSRKEVAMLALPEEHFLNPGKKATAWTRPWKASPLQRPQCAI